MKTLLYLFFYQVKVRTWVDGIEDAEFVGIGARFGRTIESEEKKAPKAPLTLSDPRDCCITPKNKVICSYIIWSFVLWSRQ